MPAASLHALLAHSIDYAGMFPPCNLELEPALRNQAQYVRSNDAWMLNSFVLSVEQLEMPLPRNIDLAWLRDARATIGDLKLHVFWEAPPDAAEGTIALLAQLKEPRFGYKLRTGGVTADAFPTPVQVAESLIAATQHHVPVKFTAGLHHPVRQFREEVGAKMHGFLNVLGAAVLASEHHWDEGQIVQMLEDERADASSFNETIFVWREWEMTAERINARRKYVTSFGSCSFDEPREELRA